MTTPRAEGFSMPPEWMPHERTWSLEHQEIRLPGHNRLLQLSAFAELRHHF